MCCGRKQAKDRGLVAVVLRKVYSCFWEYSRTECKILSRVLNKVFPKDIGSYLELLHACFLWKLSTLDAAGRARSFLKTQCLSTEFWITTYLPMPSDSLAHFSLSGIDLFSILDEQKDSFPPLIHTNIQCLIQC